ncbi:predicted protein [Scheffersomyces stipitis CBS 6054]|uniref:Protein FMP42 n=1 Tax=Scheffersomyces stipitis (strain ATCC 58785 / CBS 6054 / NBRC 10063 / NRRL Y-11545) TaxID=322104 RepID=A3LP62_PICST|nr:predicted protein [Scheffersomyces stipitis CBS 6054]ABN64988.2 predicted protein [Scheffersomyces stipitis CBS 6054]KAG2735931.1 hypothetical protein G9P44_000021 [Scheffersomyces stipitis]
MHRLPPLTTRIVQVSCAIIWCLVAAGPVFGFAALKPILISEGIYRERCEASSAGLALCDEQDLSLNFLFTLACMVTNICALPVGSILDSFGPKVTGIIGSILLALGGLTMSFAAHISFVDPYLTGYTFLALAGPFVFISCFQLANSFPKNSGLVLALLTGAFDSSSALFLFYRLYYTEISQLPLSRFFSYYLAVPVFIFVAQVFIMPTESYKTIGTLAKIAETGIDETGRPLDDDLLLPEDRNDDSTIRSEFIIQPSITETTSLLMHRASFGNARRASVISRNSIASRNSMKSVYEQEADAILTHKSGGVFGILHGYPITEQFHSWWFYLMTIFTTIQMLRINFFVATVKAQELYLYNGDEEIATAINQFFDLALPLGGLIAIPFIGLILDNLTTLAVLYILTILSVFIGVMGFFSWLPATYAGIMALVVYRPFYYTAISDISAKIFGYDNFGTIYGTIIAFSGFCNILQQVFDKVTHEVFHMNPTPVNLSLTALTAIIGSLMVAYVRSKELELKRKNLEIEASEAASEFIPT